MAGNIDRLVIRLRDEGQRVVEFFNHLNQEQTTQQVYSDGACWNAREILAHVVVTEEWINALVQDILRGGAGAPDDFDLDAFNQSHVDELYLATVEELLHRFGEMRRINTELAGSMRQEELTKRGRHPFLGETTVQEILHLLVLHAQIHLRDIRRSVI